jgi:signal transduction histidine kinase
MHVVDQRELETRSRLASLNADVGVALTQTGNLEDILQRCADAIVNRLDASLARIWTLNAAAQVLELRASAGSAGPRDGSHDRVPVGTSVIGHIAAERRPRLSTQVATDPATAGEEWTRRDGIVAFAGYPLMLGSDLAGVLAVFARHPLEGDDLDALASVAQGVALGIARQRDMDRLRESEARAVERANALARITAELQRRNSELDAFAYAASHDLRAPLRGIANLAQWIEEDLQQSLSDDTREMLALMRSRMHRMEALIDGILQYSRAGRVHEPPEEVNTAALIHEIVDLLSPETARVIVDASLPVLFTERLPLRQVLQNLIGNAIKHGGPSVTITVSAEDAGSMWQFQVKDDGPGIPEALQGRIWGIFQTLEPRDKTEGTGIGLSLVKKLVEAQGGTVAVHSRQGEGAAFTFTWWKNS